MTPAKELALAADIIRTQGRAVRDQVITGNGGGIIRFVACDEKMRNWRPSGILALEGQSRLIGSEDMLNRGIRIIGRTPTGPKPPTKRAGQWIDHIVEAAAFIALGFLIVALAIWR